MNNNYIALFPGQGSQKIGMGKDFYDAFPVAQDMFAAADQVLGYSLSKICFEGPDSELVKTENVQPAILVTSCIAFEVAKERLAGGTMLAAAGHSLGEYSALVTAGAIKFEDAVVLVNKRGRYMQAAVPLGQGKMIAVLGVELADLEDKLSQISGIAEIANINAPGQIVVSGSASGIDQAKEVLSGSKVIELNVSAPFHCTLMQPAAEQLAKDLDQLEISPAKVPVYSNFHAQPVMTPEDIRQALKDQVCGRVRWLESVQNIAGQYTGTKFIEFGAGAVLSGLIKRIDRALDKANVSSPEDLEALKN